MRYCLAPMCPQLVDRRDAYCPDHAPLKAAWARPSSSTARGWAWSKVRRRVLNRAKNRCEVAGCVEPAVQVDHVVPVAEGGSDDLSNLAALCAPHHKGKSDQERRRGQQRQRERGSAWRG